MYLTIYCLGETETLNLRVERMHFCLLWQKFFPPSVYYSREIHIVFLVFILSLHLCVPQFGAFHAVMSLFGYISYFSRISSVLGDWCLCNTCDFLM